MWGGSNGFNLNQVDPNLSYQYKGLTDQSVANPFYNLPANIMPGSLRTQPTVAVSQLLRPYPQYGNLTMRGWPGGTDHYYGLALKAERPMAKGLAFMAGYNYNQEYHSQVVQPNRLLITISSRCGIGDSHGITLRLPGLGNFRSVAAAST